MTEAACLLVIVLQFLVIAALILSGMWFRNKDQETFCKALIALKNTAMEVLQECIKSSQFSNDAPPVEEGTDDDSFSID